VRAATAQPAGLFPLPQYLPTFLRPSMPQAVRYLRRIVLVSPNGLLSAVLHQAYTVKMNDIQISWT
jgi:hypothetical protein